MEALINYLHDVCSPFCGAWLNDTMPLLGYVNSIANAFYLYFGIKYTKAPKIHDLFGTAVWLPVLALVCLSGIYYKNIHQTTSFFMAFVFLFIHCIVIAVRYCNRRKKLKKKPS